MTDHRRIKKKMITHTFSKTGKMKRKGLQIKNFERMILFLSKSRSSTKTNNKNKTIFDFSLL
jgi:hypothetical protein